VSVGRGRWCQLGAATAGRTGSARAILAQRLSISSPSSSSVGARMRAISPGRGVSILNIISLGKNRGDIGKSQSKWTASSHPAPWARRTGRRSRGAGPAPGRASCAGARPRCGRRCPAAPPATSGHRIEAPWSLSNGGHGDSMRWKKGPLAGRTELSSAQWTSIAPPMACSSSMTWARIADDVGSLASSPCPRAFPLRHFMTRPRSI
jgi:hypothetical protein